jgi:hypothetical protein
LGGDVILPERLPALQLAAQNLDAQNIGNGLV